MGSGWRSGRHCLHQSLFSESFVTYAVSAEQTSSTLASHYRHNKLQMQSAKPAVTPSFISNRLWVGGCAEPSTYRTNDHSAGTGAKTIAKAVHVGFPEPDSTWKPHVRLPTNCFTCAARLDDRSISQNGVRSLGDLGCPPEYTSADFDCCEIVVEVGDSQTECLTDPQSASRKQRK